MKKYLVLSIIMLILLSLLTSCAPKTGEAKIEFPEEYTKVGKYRYKLDSSYYGKKINFRQFVEVNDDTSWVLSTKSSGADPIKDFTVTLKKNNTYYVVCSDRIGISNSYKISIQVEGKIKNFFFSEFDSDAIYTSFYNSFNGNGNTDSDTLKGTHRYINFWEYYLDYLWPEIERQKVRYATFYDSVEGLESNNKNLFPEPPTKAGYKFDGWEKVCYSDDNYTLTKENGQYTYYVYVAKWTKI